MIQITWVEVLLVGWLMATLVFSIGFCILQYRKYSESAGYGLYAGFGQHLDAQNPIASGGRYFDQ